MGASKQILFSNAPGDTETPHVVWLMLDYTSQKPKCLREIPWLMRTNPLCVWWLTMGREGERTSVGLSTKSLSFLCFSTYWKSSYFFFFIAADIWYQLLHDRAAKSNTKWYTSLYTSFCVSFLPKSACSFKGIFGNGKAPQILSRHYEVLREQCLYETKSDAFLLNK